MTKAPIHPAEQAKLSANSHYVEELIKGGQKILDDANRWNTLTLEQFRPLIPFFTKEFDRERCRDDLVYRRQWDQRWKRLTQDLNLNPFQPTLVIRAKEDPTELYFIDRGFTQIAADHVDVGSARSSVGINPMGSLETRDSIILGASIQDLATANNTPERHTEISRARMISSVFMRHFVEKNLDPEKRAELMKSVTPTASAVENGEPTPGLSEYTPGATLFDDEDE